MKRKPFRRSEWALLLLPFLAFAGLTFWSAKSPIRNWWMLRKSETQTQWSSLVWSPDSRFVALGGGVVVYHPPTKGAPRNRKPSLSRGDLKIYDVNGDVVRRFIGHAGPVDKTEFSPDGTKLMGGNASGIRLWDVKTGKQLYKISLPFSDLKWAASSNSLEGTSKRVVRQSGQLTLAYSAVRIDAVTGRVVSTGLSGPKVTLREVRSRSGLTARQREERTSLSQITPAYARPVIAYNGGEVDILRADGHILQTIASQTLTDFVWRNDDILTLLCPIKNEGETLDMVLLTVNARTRVQTGRLLNLQPFEKPAQTPGASITNGRARIDAPQGGIISPNGQRVAVWSYKTLWLLDAPSATVLTSWPVQTGLLSSKRIQFSPDSRHLAWLESNELRIVDATTGDADNNETP